MRESGNNDGLRNLEINLTTKCFRSLGHCPWNLVWENQGGSERSVMHSLMQVSKSLIKNGGMFNVKVDWPERRKS